MKPHYSCYRSGDIYLFYKKKGIGVDWFCVDQITKKWIMGFGPFIDMMEANSLWGVLIQ